MPNWLDKDTVTELLRSLLHAELSAYRGVKVDSAPDQLAMDSLERLYLAACASEFFNLHETGIEDMLLMKEGIDAWAALMMEAIPFTSGLTFRTSGSTGAPKTCHHSWESIEAEAVALHQRLQQRLSPRRVVSWLPLHHLYGFMLGIAYPRVNGLPRISAETALPSLRSGDLLISVPPRWGYLATAYKQWPDGVAGVTSTGPLSPATAEQLTAHGLTALLEIYGSSETGGVATRWLPSEAFTLLEHWQKASDDGIASPYSPTGTALPDDVAWHDDRHFNLGARRDDLISIGGTKVSPRQVASRIEALAEVRQCAVRPFVAGDGQTRLKAYVVPSAGESQASTALTTLLACLPAAQRPIAIRYGDALPSNDLGKLCDWQP